MTCDACAHASARPICGIYRVQCAECCARLVLSAYPGKARAAGMLAAIERCPGSPGRGLVLASVRRGLEHRGAAAAGPAQAQAGP